MEILEEFPLFPSEEDNSEEWYADIYKKTNLTKEDLEIAHKDSIEESKELYIEASSDDLLDLDLPVAMPLYGGLHSIRNAEIREDKLYLDEEKKNVRYSYINKQDGNPRNEAVILLKPDENRLFEIITQLPYGLIDKQATGIGATYTEMHSERNSIIVVPTIALGENKSAENPDKFLYVGSRSKGKASTSDEDILKHLNSSGYKKFIVVANSLDRLINKLESEGIDVYREYFLMIDEVDSIQSDNHFRPELSDIIDYYQRFKLQRRALVSATVKDFSDPQLQNEPLTTIKREEPLSRNITLLHTNNVNQLVADEIRKRVVIAPAKKILIAYNSITDMLKVISKLSSELEAKCGILCSTSSKDKAGRYFTTINSNDRLSKNIVFMTSSYFAGVDIKDRCHLITVSNKRCGYTMLPLNKMTQIAGRCRNGILSDTIIYNTLNKPYRYWDNKKNLLDKASKVVEYLNVANEIKKNSKSLEPIFDRIKTAVVKDAGEIFFSNALIPLTRMTIDNKPVIAYFNIDYLHEQMESLSLLYSDINSLKIALEKKGNSVSLKVKNYELVENGNPQKESDEVIRLRVQNCIKDIAHTSPLTDDVLDRKYRFSNGVEKEYYKRFKELYKYLDIRKLNEVLLDICTKDKRSYRSFRNGVLFWALEKSHPLKNWIITNFEIGKSYNTVDEIEKPLKKCLEDQLLMIEDSPIKFFNSIIETKREPKVGKYTIEGYISSILRELQVITPITTIPLGGTDTDFFMYK